MVHLRELKQLKIFYNRSFHSLEEVRATAENSKIFDH